jgi:putative ABC transport system permease protein
MVAFLNWFIGEDLGIDLQVAVTPRSFITAFCIGVIATFIVITIASVRASRLNIVAAIRDLPESRSINPEERTVFGYLRGVLNGLAAFGITVISLVLGLRFGSNPGLMTLFFATAAIGLIGPWLYVLRGHNFSASADDRKQNGGIPWWPIILGLVTLPLAGLGLVILVTYGLAMLLVRFTRDRRPSRVPGWSMVLAIIVAPLGLIFAALQDRDRQIAWSVGVGTVGLVLAIILFQWGLDANRSFQFFAGVSLMFLWAVVTLRYFGAHERATFTIASAALLVLWYLPSDVYEKLFGELNGDAEMAFISGVVMVACGTFIIVYNADLLLAPLARMGGSLGRFYPAVMTAIAYPLTARFRTGMTVAMIGLISFALVLFATFNSNISQIFLNNDATGGFDDVVQVNSNNAIDDFEGALQERGVDTTPIAAVAENRTADLTEVEVRDPSEAADEATGEVPWKRYTVIGADQSFLDATDLGFEHRAAGYDSDEAIWTALAQDNKLVVIPAALTQPSQGFGGPPVEDSLSLTDRDFPDGFEPFPLEFRDAGGNITQLTVIGVVKTSGGTFWNGIIMPMPTFESIYPSVQAQSFYITLNDGTDAKEYARTIEASLVQVSSDSLKSLLDDFRRQNTGFLYLFQGFMGLGLLVGIAALGVIAFRAVVERRQQIGMLRAIGYRRGMVALSFVVESAFIALSGILLGLVLGLSLSWVLFTFDSVTEGTDQAPFVVPWIELLVICGVAFGASLLMTFLPARSASRVAVAEALRYE